MRLFARPKFVVATVLLAVSLAAGVGVGPAEAASVPVPSAANAPAVLDEQSAADGVSASAVAVKFQHPVVDDSQTTETNEVSALPDGTMQLTTSSVPVRVKRGSGWVKADSTLVAGADGRVAPTAAAVPVEFSPGGSSEMARVETETGEWVTESWPYGSLPAPTLSGSTATYPGVLPDVDLVLTATSTGMSEVLVVKTAAAAATAKLADLSLTVGGASVSSKATGQTEATAPDGSVLSSSTPSWWDSSTEGSGTAGPGLGGFAQPLDHEVTPNAMALHADSVAQGDQVAYPLYLDPDWTGGPYNWWFIDRAWPTSSYLNTGSQQVGYSGSLYSQDGRNHWEMSLWEMDTVPIEGKHIVDARFTAWNTLTNSAGCAKVPVDLWWLNPVVPGTSWNGTPASAWYSDMSENTAGYGGHAACPNSQQLAFSALPAVQAAAVQHAPSLTLSLRMPASQDGNSSSWNQFASATQLIVTYNAPPTTPANPSFSSPQRGCGTTPATAVYVNDAVQPLTMSVYVTDPDSSGTNVAYYVVDGTTLAQVARFNGAQSSLTTKEQQIPQGASYLTPGHLYAWHAQAGDLIDLSPGYSPYCYFFVKNGPSGSLSVPASASGTVGQPMSVTYGSSPTDHVAVIGYWWASSTSSTPPSPPVSTAGSTGSALPACGAQQGVERFVCPNAAGSATVTVAPVDAPFSTLWAIAYDAAGNVSTAKAVQVSGAADTTNVDFSAGHGWIFEGLPSPLVSPLADANQTNPVALTVGAGIDTTQTDTVNGVPDTPVLSFPGDATGQATALAGIDTTKSYTVSAWVKPEHAQGSSQYNTIMSQNGAVNSAFLLQEAPGGFLRFCVQSQSAATIDCATSPSPTADDEWVFVTGVWDAVNGQVRLLRGDSIVPLAVAGHVAPAGEVSASGPLAIGSALAGGAVVAQWSGMIDDPTIFPGVLALNQLDSLFFQSPPQ